MQSTQAREFDMAQTIRAEMVASVHSVLAIVGDQVETGATLVILESMKMEIPVLAEQAGTISEISVEVGDVVREGDVIAIIG
jgi:acetyl-CoA carboxylase biotin carboxyl carrier protein